MSNPKETYHNREWLTSAREKMPIRKIASICGVSTCVLTTKFKQFGIEGVDHRSTKSTESLSVALTHCKRRLDKVPIPMSVLLNDNTAYVFGLYLAEGHTSSKSVQWTYRTEEGFSTFLSEFADSMGLNWAIRPVENGSDVKCEHFIISNATMASIFTAMFGKGARKKKLPHEVFCWSISCQLALLRGYLDGDGHLCKISGNTIYSTVSCQLAFDIKLLAAQVGVDLSIRKVKSANSFLGEAEHSYRGVIPAKSRGLIYVDEPMREEIRSARSFVDRSFIWSKVHRIIERDYDGVVYNFSVHEDQTYLLASGVVHNCFKYPPHAPVLYAWHENESKQGGMVVIGGWGDKSHIWEVAGAGGGCLLVKRSVFDRIKNDLGENPFDVIGQGGEDLSFFHRLRKLGIKAFVDDRIQCHHLVVKSLSLNDYDPGASEMIPLPDAVGYLPDKVGA